MGRLEESSTNDRRCWRLMSLATAADWITYGPRRAPKESGAVHMDISPSTRELSSLRGPFHIGGPPASPQGVERCE
jgi:hypothetical protein